MCTEKVPRRIHVRATNDQPTRMCQAIVKFGRLLCELWSLKKRLHFALTAHWQWGNNILMSVSPANREPHINENVISNFFRCVVGTASDSRRYTAHSQMTPLFHPHTYSLSFTSLPRSVRWSIVNSHADPIVVFGSAIVGTLKITQNIRHFLSRRHGSWRFGCVLAAACLPIHFHLRPFYTFIFIYFVFLFMVCCYLTPFHLRYVFLLRVDFALFFFALILRAHFIILLPERHIHRESSTSQRIGESTQQQHHAFISRPSDRKPSLCVYKMGPTVNLNHFECDARKIPPLNVRRKKREHDSSILVRHWSVCAEFFFLSSVEFVVALPMRWCCVSSSRISRLVCCCTRRRARFFVRGDRS